MTTQPVTIVLAEDDDGHASLIQRNLERAGLANGFIRCKDGQETLDYFRGEGTHAGRVLDPSVLLLLDINMPRVDGVEVLRDESRLTYVDDSSHHVDDYGRPPRSAALLSARL